MKTFKLRADEFRVMNKGLMLLKVLQRSRFNLLMYVTVFFGVFTFISETMPKLPFIGLFILIIILVVLQYRRMMTALRADWLSYQVVLEDERLTKTQKSTGEIVIQKDEVVQIVEIPERGLSIQTGEATRNLFLPAHLTDYAELHNLLMDWKPIIVSPLSDVLSDEEAETLAMSPQMQKMSMMKSVLLSILKVFGLFVGVILLMFTVVYFLSRM